MTQMDHNSQNKIQELNSFYQEVIVDHFKHPRFKGCIRDCRFCQEGKNPVCGDVVSIYCKVTTEKFQTLKPDEQEGLNSRLHVYFDGSGCTISQASASIMCEIVHNKTIFEAKSAIKAAEQIYTGKQKVDPEDLSSDIDALHGISQFPARVKCAALPWKTLECLLTENFDANGLPISRSCNKHLAALKQQKKLRVITTEPEK